MPTPEVDPTALQAWFAQNIIWVLVVGGFLLVLYAYSNRIVRAVVGRFVSAQSRLVEDGSTDAVELQKRTATLESLTRTLLRASVIAILVVLVVGSLGLWGLLAGLGLFLAALTLAGQPIVLDYLMGLFVIVEGQYFEGDSIRVGQISGTVETVGLRRTVIRSASGTVHSISNGELRIVSNQTRIFAAAEVTVRGIREQDLDRVIEIMERTGSEVAADPEFQASVMEAPAPAFIDDPDDLGNTAVMRGKVVAADRWRVSAEIRRRLNRSLVDEGIMLNKRGLAPPSRRDLEATGYTADTDESVES